MDSLLRVAESRPAKCGRIASSDLLQPNDNLHVLSGDSLHSVRFGSLADVRTAKNHVALPPKADIRLWLREGSKSYKNFAGAVARNFAQKKEPRPVPRSRGSRV